MADKKEFDETLISLLPQTCIDDAARKYSQAQENLKEVEKLHNNAGSPDALASGSGLPQGVSK